MEKTNINQPGLLCKASKSTCFIHINLFHSNSFSSTCPPPAIMMQTSLLQLSDSLSSPYEKAPGPKRGQGPWKPEHRGNRLSLSVKGRSKKQLCPQGFLRGKIWNACVSACLYHVSTSIYLLSHSKRSREEKNKDYVWFLIKLNSKIIVNSIRSFIDWVMV